MLFPTSVLAAESVSEIIYKGRVEEVLESGQKFGIKLISGEARGQIVEAESERELAVGDRVLHHVTSALWSCQKDRDYVGRLGGDEFAMYVTNFDSNEELSVMCEGIFAELKKGFDVNDCMISVRISLGIAIYPDNAVTYEDLYVRADAAMYIAKRTGKNKFVFYEKDMEKEKRVL